ncbi:hypothetical protein PTKIN_Ptkin11bG0038300 [Pterospermum kingtungense]
MQHLSRERKPKVVAMEDNNISLNLKAVVDKTNNRVVFVESDDRFFDLLFSFFTIPLGTTVRLTRNRPPATSIGCMNNLYNSVEILDKRYFRTEPCKTMLLYPRNGANAQCRNLKLKIDDSAPLKYFICEMSGCYHNLLSHYRNAICECGGVMTLERNLKEKRTTGWIFDDQDGGVFVKGPVLLTISDELRVMPSSNSARISLFSKLGIKDTSTIEETTFSMEVLEALKLLKCLLVSKTPLTEALLEQYDSALSLNIVEAFEQLSFRNVKTEEVAANNEDGKIQVKLMVSKSKNMVCYAEANEKFVDLLFSFLTVPLGFIAKEMQEGSSKACITHLYDSIQDLDARQCLVSRENTVVQDFLGPAMFTITDDLIITPLSSVAGLSAVRELKVPFSDIEERIVYVGKEEASRLLVASFVSGSALTNTFLVQHSKQGS